MKKSLHLAKHFMLLTLSLTLFSCASTEKLMDEGRYDELVYLAKKKLSGKKKKKERYVLALEGAFNRIQERDLRQIDRYKSESSLRGWESMYDLAMKIERRQEGMMPYLPLVDENGYQAKFNFIKTNGFISEAREKVSALLYSQALDDMQDARSGNMIAARNAYHKLEHLGEYNETYQNRINLMNESRELGTAHVWLDYAANTDYHVPGEVFRTLFSTNFKKFKKQWTRYYVQPESEIDFDYKATLEITDLFVGPDAIGEEEFVKIAEIEDGFRYVVDDCGNILTDTLGNKLTEPNIIEVKGSVLVTTQTKTATIHGTIKVLDMRRRAVVETRPVLGSAVFEHEARRHFGDVRALNHHDRQFIGLVSFPSDHHMILRATDALKPTFLKELNKCRFI